MAPKLYLMAFSPPVRAVQMTAKALDLELEEIEIDLFNKEHYKPEYLKMNPQHTVPTLVDDDGFVIWDSHAIMAYLVAKYGKDDSLYPKDLKKRAIVDQRLHFDSGTCFPRITAISRPIFFHGKQSLTQSDKDSITEAYAFMEVFLEDKEWMAGNSVTIADYALIASISSSNLLIPIDKEKYPRLFAWLRRAETLPAYERNKKGLEMLKNILKSKLDG